MPLVNRSLLVGGSVLLLGSLLLGVFLPAVEKLLLAGPYLIAMSGVAGTVFGTSRSTPIAGAGLEGDRWQEIVVSVGLAIGSTASVIAVFGLLRVPPQWPGRLRYGLVEGRYQTLGAPSPSSS